MYCEIFTVDFMGYTRAAAIPITFPAGSTETTIEVQINNDQLVERTTEQFTGRIVSGGGLSNLNIFTSHATVDIMDNDGSRSTLSLSLSLSLLTPVAFPHIPIIH